MSTTNRDSSLITARRRQLALYTWRSADQYPSNPQSQRAEQAPSHGWKGTGPTSDVPLAALQGALLVGQAPGATAPANGICGCSANVTLQGYSKNSPGC